MGYTISSCVNELLIEMNEGQSNKFARFYQFGVAGYRKFNQNTNGVPQVIELTLNSNDTADLPLDYVQYTKIALCSGGLLFPLGLNNSLCLTEQFNDCGVPIATQPINVVGTTQASNGTLTDGFLGGPFIADNFRNGEFVGRMFGAGSDNNSLGYYRIDRTRNQILFSNLTLSPSVNITIVMEYLADINVDADGDYQVHPFVVEALKDWIFWKHKQRASRPLGEQQMARDDFHNSSRLMRQAFASATIDEWSAALESGNQATPKFR